MRAWTRLLDRLERDPLARETVNAVQDGARWGWLIALIAGAAAWAGRGFPSPGTAAIAASAMVVGTAAAALRAWRRMGHTAAPVDRRVAATTAARRWATAYGLLAAAVPLLVMTRDGRGGIAVTVAYIVFLVLLALALLTLQPRARARLLGRLRIGARAVAGTEDVRVGRALWSGMHLLRVLVTYPADWPAHRGSRRDDLVERIMWELCGPAPRTAAEAIARPEYLSRFDHIGHRLVVEQVPALPLRLTARPWGQPDGTIVLGQTTAEAADTVLHGVPVALHTPDRHLLITGATQFGKSSGARAWVASGLDGGAFPGGLLAALDGKGSGSFVALEGRHGVGPIAVTPDQWTHVLRTVVMPEVDARYQAMLDYRRGLGPRPAFGRALVVLDEIQQILASCPDLLEDFGRLARQALEAEVILWVLTQRPDAKDAVPGAIRDQLDERAAFGPLSAAGAKMVFDGDDWHRAMGTAPIQGRALTRLGGVWRPVQVPWLPFPVDEAWAEELYPPRTATAPTPSPAHPPADPRQRRQEDPWRGYGPPPAPHPTHTPSPPPQAPPPDQPRRWPPSPPHPRPAPETAPETAPGSPPPPRTADPVEELLRDFDAPPPAPADGPDVGEGQEQPEQPEPSEGPAPYDPDAPYAHRRRRRRD